jgi:hypothetical protein
MPVPVARNQNYGSSSFAPISFVFRPECVERSAALIRYFVPRQLTFGMACHLAFLPQSAHNLAGRQDSTLWQDWTTKPQGVADLRCATDRAVSGQALE